ncbi:hypothetical protein EDD63_1821 [Breznakia blatticola]|uniref:Uncharacterized protein n=1 Tax=Breznakia blatticola TaxID=1754012 RepID=A0A4R7ZBT0_9FIRM|nr:hypothetical protein [Breznakia blatticola]TDW07917.1 hypothetical protein EDD63_1821 [Breznakia blatticola]
MKNKVLYNCIYEDDDLIEWEATVEHTGNNKENHETIFTGRGSKIIAVIGQSTNGNWICFPEREYGCYLSSLDDVFWNQEKIENGLGIIDAQTVAKGLKYLKTII